MSTCLRFTLALFACTAGVFSLPATAQVLNATQPIQYVPLEVPCRAVDTRVTNNPISGGTFGSFNPAGGGCNIDKSAGGPIAYALNVTALPRGRLDTLTIWPAGEAQPLASTLNSYDGRIKANAAIVAGGANGQVSVFMSNTADLILDVSGYFVTTKPPVLTYTYFPITPCRVVDTRNSDGPFGGPFLAGGQQRDFVFSQSNCHLPPDPWEAGGAYSLNVTVIPRNGKPVGHVTVWGTSHTHPDPPLASTINDPTGTVVANAAIVTANPGYTGGVSVFATDDADVVIDVSGYFALFLKPGGLSLYTLTPCRILDTRLTTREFHGERTVPVTTGNNCSLPGTAQAYVFNATVLPITTLGYLTLWPDGLPLPTPSTLNAEDGAVASNMAIVGTTNGSIDAFADLPTQLILDVTAYFAP
jgi:hypothetical protein